MTVTERQIDAILSGKAIERDKPVIPIIEQSANEFVTELLDTFTQTGVDLAATHVAFAGGGSVLLRKFIEQSSVLQDFSFIDDVKANVEGYELLYRAQMRAKKNK